MMNFFKDDHGGVFSFSDEDIKEIKNNIDGKLTSLLDRLSGLTAMSEEEVYSHLNPVATVEDKSLEVRSCRDEKMKCVADLVDRYKHQSEAGIKTSDSNERYIEMLNYMQELREVPQQIGFPFNVVWPELNL